MSQVDKIRNTDEKTLREIVEKSFSFSQVVKAFGVNNRSSHNINILKDKIAEYEISTEHFGPYNTIYKNQDKLIETVKSSISLNEVLKKMGFRPAGVNYASLRKWIKELKFTCRYFTSLFNNKTFYFHHLPIT